MNKRDIDIEFNMLQGNINRMLSSNDEFESERMKIWAIQRIELLFIFKKCELLDQKNEKDII